MSDTTDHDFGYEVPAPLAATSPGNPSDWHTIVTGGESNGRTVREQAGPDPSNARTVSDLPGIVRVADIFWSYHEVDKAEERGTELTVYAVVEFADGRFGFVHAGNDSTGWGCHDHIDWWVGEAGWIARFGVTDEARRLLSWPAEQAT